MNHGEPSVPSAHGGIEAVGACALDLDERSRAVIDFEREAWKLTVTKERAIRERFGFSPSRYHQLLHRIIDRPEALAYDPMVVRRLRRVREARRRPARRRNSA